MKITFVTEDLAEAKTLLEATSVRAAVHSYEQKLRAKIKYDDNISDDYRSGLEAARQMLCDEMEEFVRDNELE